MEELEALDIPRGVVAAANRFAASKVPLVNVIKQMGEMEEGISRQAILISAQEIYKQHFDDFISGAQWCLGELAKKSGKPFSRTIHLDRCDDFAHVIESDADTCRCGARKRNDP